MVMGVPQVSALIPAAIAPALALYKAQLPFLLEAEEEKEEEEAVTPEMDLY